MTGEIPDEVLAARAARGDADAFRSIYDRYSRMVHTLALRLVRNDADAEDVLQQAFLRVHRALPKFRGDSKLSTWIWQVALSVALTERRRTARGVASLDDADAPEAEAPGPTPHESAAARDDAAWLADHIARLPRRDAAVLHLRYREERPFEEIAQILGVPVGTAKSLVFRAKAELRRNMELDGHAM